MTDSVAWPALVGAAKIARSRSSTGQRATAYPLTDGSAVFHLGAECYLSYPVV